MPKKKTLPQLYREQQERAAKNKKVQASNKKRHAGWYAAHLKEREALFAANRAKREGVAVVDDEGEDLAELSRDELRERAKALGVSGVGSMTKAALRAAITEAEGQ